MNSKPLQPSSVQGPLVGLTFFGPCTIEKALELMYKELDSLSVGASVGDEWFHGRSLANVLKIGERLPPYEGTGWLEEASRACETFIFYKKYLPEFQAKEAENIGKIITRELMAGNYSAPRIVGEGLLKIAAGKPFHPDVIRPDDSWKARLAVGLTFFHLRNQGSKNPAQTEVRLALSKEGVKISKKSVSVYFHELGLAQYSSDARKADSDAGRRRRTQ